MVYSRATRGAGIVIHVIRSVVVDTGQPTERARSCGFRECDSTMRLCTGTSAGASSRAGPRGQDLIRYPGRRPDISRRRSVYRPSPKPAGRVLSTYNPTSKGSPVSPRSALPFRYVETRTTHERACLLSERSRARRWPSRRRLH